MSHSAYAYYLNGERVPEGRIVITEGSPFTETEAPDEAIPSPEERPDLGNPDRRDTPVTEPPDGSGG